MKIKFNEERAEKVFRILKREWVKKRGVFENIVLPQTRWLPKMSPKDRAHFFFYAAIFMRGGVISEDPFRILVLMWQRHKYLFDPLLIVNFQINEKDIIDVISSLLTDAYVGKNKSVKYTAAHGAQTSFLGDLYPEEIAEKHKKFFSSSGIETDQNGGPIAYKIDQFAKAWIHNSRVVVDRFSGDARNIFKNVSDFEEAFARVDNRRKENRHQGIFGMRRKIFALFTIWLQEERLIPIFPTPIPVDFHALRLLWTTNIFDFELPILFASKAGHPDFYSQKEAIRISEDFVNKITIWTQDILHRLKISHLIINPAVWVLSRELCANNIQNQSRSGGDKIIDPEDLKGDPGLWPKNYYDPCEVCPLEKYCGAVVPASPYYTWGILMKLPRIKYPYPRPDEQAMIPGIPASAGEKLNKYITRRTKK